METKKKMHRIYVSSETKQILMGIKYRLDMPSADAVVALLCKAHRPQVSTLEDRPLKTDGRGKHPNSHKHKTVANQTSFKANELHPGWKGDKVQYRALHIWIRKNKPLQDFCNGCKQQKRLYASNISGDYKRDISDFEWLCQKCHMKKDWVKIKQTGVKATDGR